MIRCPPHKEFVCTGRYLCVSCLTCVLCVPAKEVLCRREATLRSVRGGKSAKYKAAHYCRSLGEEDSMLAGPLGRTGKLLDTQAQQEGQEQERDRGGSQWDCGFVKVYRC